MLTHNIPSVKVLNYLLKTTWWQAREYLGYKTEFKAKWLFISRASIHEVSKQQNQLQQPRKFAT